MSEQEFLKQLGEKIRLARKKAGLTQDKVSSAIPMSWGKYSFIENGRVSSRITTLRRICEVIGIDLKDLL